MKADQASSTAEAGLAVRALESLRSKESRLFEDPYAAQLLSSRNQWILSLCKIPPFGRAMEKLLDSLYPGVPSDFICRTRYIDDALSEALALGAERVVIAGAGYDTRSFKFAAEKFVEVIEMDHPATQKHKIESARKLLSMDHLKRIKFVSIDLSKPHALTEIPSAAFSQSKKTAFVLEGLTGYLTEESIDSLFDWMRSVSLPGSRVIFTYVDQDFIDGKDMGPASQRIFKYLEKTAEPFISGWKPEVLPIYCESRGFKLLETCSSADCVERYLAPLGRSLNKAHFFHLAIAEVF